MHTSLHWRRGNTRGWQTYEASRVIDIASTDSFLDAPALVEKLSDKRLGEPSPDAPKLPKVDH